MEELLLTVHTSDSNTDDTYRRFERSAADLAQEQLWDELSSLYSDNEKNLKTRSAALDPSSASKDMNGDDSTGEKLDNLLDGFMNGANAVLEELTFLGNAHPALAVAIFAFHEVVKLDIARRDNNKKVLVVVLQMQSMLGPMFQLRNLDHTHMPEAEKRFHEGRLKEIVDVITRDIKMCRSDITHFMNRKFVYKLVLAKGYEKKFASHIETFAQRRSELQSVISEYIAIGISSANIAIGQVGHKIDSMDIKVDKIISVLFRHLDTPRERDVFKFMQQNGGPEKCVNDLDLLPKLISKAGESPKTGKFTVSDQAELRELQKALSEALKEDLDKVLEKHYSRFEKVLQVQSNNLKQMSAHLEDQGILMQTHTTKLGKILDTVTTIMVLEEGKFKTKSVKLKDPEIQRVWNQMNLTTSSVKAKVFVLTFRDHIRVDNSTINTPIQGPALLPGDMNSLTVRSPNASSTQDDSEWVLEYIDVAYVQPIVEAMDEDGSGFISVKEANNFALARPKDLSLLHWIAYWAAGWHLNLVEYQKELYSILVQMHAAASSIHVANRAFVDDFLDHSVMRRVEALLRSIKGLPDISKRDPHLVTVANYVSSWQLERLRTNLSDMGFVIESPFVATTISGSSRVETWIMPLLLLLLQRHLDVIQLAKTVVLDKTEFEAHVTSLTSIFVVFDERMENLEAKFQQLHKDVDAQFNSFSYGMFYAAFKKTEFDASLNNVLGIKADEYASDKNAYPHLTSPDLSVLSKPPGRHLNLEDIDIYASEPRPPDHLPHPIEGAWFAWFEEGIRYLRPNRCFISPVVDGKIVAKGESFFGAIDITGVVKPGDADASTMPVEITFFPRNLEFRPIVCRGTFDPVRDSISGSFIWKADEESSANVVVTNDAETAADGNLNSKEIDIAAQASESNQASGVAGELEVIVEHDKVEGELNIPDIPPQGRQALVEPENSISEAPVERLDETDKPVTVEVPAEGAAVTENVAPQDTEQRLFFLMRTLPHLFRFRYLLDGPGPVPCWVVWPLARKRWVFAIEAVLYETRIRMNSRKAFEATLTERRQWLYHSIRYDLTESNITPEWTRFDSFTDEEWEVYDTLFLTVHPTTARIYEEMSHYMARRETYIVGRIFCDNCRKLIAFRRHQCIICLRDDLSDGVDLCVNCFSKSNTVRSGTMLHNISHPLLRSKHRVRNFERGVIIPEARLIAERSKKMFKDLEEAKKEQNERAGKSIKGKGSRKSRSGQAVAKAIVDTPEISPILCACCEKPISLPCWVCVSCSPLTFICDLCDKRNTPVLDIYRGHSVQDHHLLRIHDSVEVKPPRLRKGTEVEQQLEELNINISALEEKVNAQIDEAKEIKTVIEDVAKSVGLNDYEFAPTESVLNDFEEALALEDGTLHMDEAKIRPLEEEKYEPSKDNSDEKPEKSSRAQMDLRERLNALEDKVESISRTLSSLAHDDRHTAIVSKVDALETKIDQQFGLLLSLVQNLVSPSSTLKSDSGS
ncbi:hypothetical protein BDN70DRAFT_874437 [Pholiota conissans]|uniref:EF-hand domain-containing protein n=1 Tax=Pholiota conissans TaxID=109636 RepID=A0A9P5ZBC8_9AGAR|nr:hypothetical protein BDN70DRAFT_874437 [Pholiota conissans]